MYTLYGGEFTRALIVQMVMAEGGIDYELREVNIIDNEHRKPEFLAINPAGHIPALVKPDGEVVFETHAINLYLIDHHRLTHLGPSIDELERSLFLSGLFFLCDDLEPILKRYYYPNRYVFREEDIPAMRQLSLEQSFQRLAVIDKRMQDKGPYFLGERFSVIDIISCYWSEEFNTEDNLEPYPGIRHCMSLVKERPAIKAMFALLENRRAEYANMQAQGGGVK
ncbi:MAG: glutathione S-transferase [Gammaproteobacteria bacterium]|jgi:glutathione S-transferase